MSAYIHILSYDALFRLIFHHTTIIDTTVLARKILLITIAKCITALTTEQSVQLSYKYALPVVFIP
jgi:hypothetical protein